MLEVRANRRLRDLPVPDLLDVFPQHMYRQALSDGSGPDGESGFVYTVNFESRPVVRHRMHWVLYEAIGAAASLSAMTGDPADAYAYACAIDGYWFHAKEYLIDQPGQRIEEVDSSNPRPPAHGPGSPTSTMRTRQCWSPASPMAPSFARAQRALG